MPFPWLMKMYSMFHYYSITLLQCKAAGTDKFHSLSLAPHCSSFPTFVSHNTLQAVLLATTVARFWMQEHSRDWWERVVL